MNSPVNYIQNLKEMTTKTIKGEAKYIWKKELIDNMEFVFCHYCETLKELHLFNIKFNNGCKECFNEIKNFKQRFSAIYRHSKKRTNERNERNEIRNKNGKILHEFTITPEFLAELYKNQKGLCAISSIPLNFNGSYCVSIERLNTDIGYTKENVCLIAVCFQSTQIQGGENMSGGRWTPEKWNVIVEKFKE